MQTIFHKIRERIFAPAIFFLLFAAIALLGFVYVYLFAVNEVGEYQRDLKEDSRIIAEMVNPERLRRLHGSLSDLQNPDYLRLKDQLFWAGNQIPHARYVFLYAKKQDKLVFLADTQPDRYPDKYSNGKDLANPGDEYAIPAPEFLAAWERGENRFTEEPYTDEWGSFYTALSPVKDKATGETLAVVGIDSQKELYDSVMRREISQKGIWVLVALLAYVWIYYLLSEKAKNVLRIKDDEKKYSVMVEAMMDPLVMIDKKGRIVEWNQAAEKVFGYKKREILGKEIHSVVAPQTVNLGHSKDFKSFIASGDSAMLNKVLELKMRDKTGKEIDTEMTMNKITQGEEWFAFGIIRDVTSQKAFLAQMEKQNKELEKMNRLMVGRELRIKELKDKLGGSAPK